MNYSKSLVDGFTFLSIIVTAANLPLYLCCAWRSWCCGVVTRRRCRGQRWARRRRAVYSVFAFIGIGREPFLWAIVLAAAGLPFYALRRFRNRDANVLAVGREGR